MTRPGRKRHGWHTAVRVPAFISLGIQDIHWGSRRFVLFGYFPTCALGNLYAATFFEQAQLAVGPLEPTFAAGDFRPLLQWLRDRIHCQGQRYTASELVQQLAGTGLSHGPLMQHLYAKLGPLYDLT